MSSISVSRTGRRWLTAMTLAVAGGALAVATWIGGQHDVAVALVAFYAVCSVAAFIWSGRDGDVAAILRSAGDERQRRLDRDATAIAGLAMIVVSIIGGIISAARNGGDLGPFGIVCAVGGLAYIVALAGLRRHG
jgi:drug/metabolite transporter (DMT)-like permease